VLLSKVTEEIGLPEMAGRAIRERAEERLANTTASRARDKRRQLWAILVLDLNVVLQISFVTVAILARDDRASIRRFTAAA